MTDAKFNAARGGRKGQVFLIGAIIITISLVLIRGSIDVGEVLEKKRFLEAGLERLEFNNVRSEVVKSAYSSINFTQNMTNITNSFIAFAENRLAGRTIQLDGASVGAAYGNYTGTLRLNVTFYNFFDVEVSRAVINLTVATPVTFSNIPPGGTRATQFTYASGLNQNLTLWVLYETATESVTHNITIPAELGRTKYVGYFDLRMSDDRGEIRDRFVEVVDAG